MPNSSAAEAQGSRTRAYRQAPWRVQTRLLAMGLAVVLTLAATLSLFVFTGAQAAQAGLQVQTLLIERDDLLRQINGQQAELASRQSESWLSARAKELGFEPVSPQAMGFIEIPPAPVSTPVYIGPAGTLYVEPGPALSPAYRQTLLDWLVSHLGQAGSNSP
ncbi:MAG: hypothetical protein ABSG98_04090 [Anaerolineales bacterium]